MKGKRKFSTNRDYKTVYRFATRFDSDGNVTKTSTITTTLPGKDIVNKGLKQTIWSNAERLNIPKGYKCMVETNDDYES